MITVNWNNLRVWENSQQTAFEELCCQLAAYERFENAKFIRKGAPDAGLECLWRMQNGDEYGWQAKFFTSSPGETQWAQIDESVKTSLQKHPRLVAFTACFPLDRADPKLPDKKYFMDKWNDHVTKWKSWAANKGMSVEFNYWGSHEICERLSREEHSGRVKFWFDKDFLSQGWFDQQLEVAIADVEARYTPELNIELPIAANFEGLGRTPLFYCSIRNQLGIIRRSLKSVSRDRYRLFTPPVGDLFKQCKERLEYLLTEMCTRSIQSINWLQFEEFCTNCDRVIDSYLNILEGLEAKQNEIKAKKQESQSSEEPASKAVHSRDINDEKYYCRKLTSEVENLQKFISGEQSALANAPFLIMTGKAGTGKTHLLCDVASNRLKNAYPTVLLLGQQFNLDEPWKQIIARLGLNCTRDEFLGALQSAAEACGSRALIFIDAINEGEGKRLWPKYLGGFLAAISRYPWIGVAVSIRSSYKTILSANILEKMIQIEHHGFEDKEYDAVRSFFLHYGITLPGVPMLFPEFHNPLFLKLFCGALQNKKLSCVPKGLKGITTIFDFYIESVNEKLSSVEYLDFNPKTPVVQRAITALADIMANEQVAWVSEERAEEIINSFLPREGFENTLFRHLMTEGVISDDRVRVDNDQIVDCIRFSYERFTDHIVARYMLDKYLDPEHPERSFLVGQYFGELFKDKWQCWQYQGLIEALSIQIPERINRELVSIAPHMAHESYVVDAFIESIIWRNTTAFSEETSSYLTNRVLRYKGSGEKFLDATLTVAMVSEHPYNALRLHRVLSSQKQIVRDTWWSTFLHEQWEYYTSNAVHRLVDWAWSEHEQSNFDPEVIKLCAIALCWFLTTPNRFLRDQSTKALVTILTDQLPILREIMQLFQTVDDLYVQERIYAAAYGCALRSSNITDLPELAADVYNNIFDKGTPVPHILLRDYARGIIEYTLVRCGQIPVDTFDSTKIRPPYSSTWPKKFPTKKWLNNHGSKLTKTKSGQSAWWHLEESVLGFGDFARYIIGTNTNSFDWFSEPLNIPDISPKDVYDEFYKKLKRKQREFVDLYRKFFPLIRGLADREEFKTKTKECSAIVKELEKEICNSLNDEQNKVFKKTIIPYLKDPSKSKKRRAFDLSIAQRFILAKIFDLGWDPEKFGAFDSSVNSHRYVGRGTHKPERMGKKYQWLAYHELLARVSDNFVFRKDGWSDETEPYDGPWQVSRLRDIDPSSTIKEIERLGRTAVWWFTTSYDNWNSGKDDTQWLNNGADLPSPLQLIEVTNPKDGSVWLNMGAFFEWESPAPAEEERFENPRKQLFYILRSCIVKKEDVEKLCKWSQRKALTGAWIADARNLSKVFLGEYYWSAAYRYFDNAYYGGFTWTKRGDLKAIPYSILVPTEHYACSGGDYDCSLGEKSIGIDIPTLWIADGLNLRWNGLEGCFYDVNGNLIAFDPSLEEDGPRTLLIRKDVLLKFLDEQNCDIIWTINGEKNLIGGNNDWKGRLVLGGTFNLEQDRIIGKIQSKMES